MSIRSLLLPLVACSLFVAGEARAQSANELYTLRQELRNDSYRLEPLLTDKTKPQPKPLINPAARERLQAALGEVRQPAPITGAARSVLNYYGNQQSAATLQRMPQRRFISNGGRGANRRPERPFSNAQSRPTISPYLNLFREESDEDLPNYFTFVRPQVRQQEANRSQQIELERLGRQVQRASYTPAQTAPSALPSTGRTAARFGDTGQFYGGWSR